MAIGTESITCNSASRGMATNGQFREQISKQRQRIIPVLVAHVAAITRTLVAEHSISQADAEQILRKRRLKQKARLLFEIVTQKPTPNLMTFVDLLKKDYSTVLERIEHSEAEALPRELTLVSKEEATTTLTDCLSDTHYGGFRFLQVLRHLTHSKVDLTAILFQSRLSLMHEIVRLDKPTLLQFISSAGLWRQLYNLPVDSTEGPYARLTPVELATILKRNKCKDTMTLVNDTESNLKEIERCVRSGDLVNFAALKTEYIRQLGNGSLEQKSLLEFACQSGQLSMLQTVIAMEQSLSEKRMSVDRALSVCVVFGFPDLLQVLVDYVPTDLSSVVVEGCSLMEEAAVSGNCVSFRELVRLGTSPKDTVVMLAAALNRLPLLKELLDPSSQNVAGISVNFQNKQGKTAAQFAAEKGHVETLRLLLEAGYDWQLTDKRGFNLLHAAAGGRGIQAVVEVILEFSRRQDCQMALLHARDRCVNAEQRFLVRGHDHGRAAWHLVEADRGLIDIFWHRTSGGHVDVAEYGHVIKSGWGANPPDVVIAEIRSEHPDVLRMSSDERLDRQPLHVAIFNKHQQVALQLVAAMEDVTQKDCFGLTPLHLAAMRGYTDVIRALQAKGASESVTDAKGRTPRDLANANNHPVAVATLDNLAPLINIEALRRNLLSANDLLSTNHIREHMLSGQDLKLHIKSTLRDMVSDINDYLFYQLDVGPIATEAGVQLNIAV